MLIFLYRKLRNLRDCNHNALFTWILFKLGLDVSKSSRDAQSSWQHSVWPIEHLLLLASHLAILISNRYALYRLGLINLSAVVLYPVEFLFFVGAVVLGELVKPHAAICWHDGPAVADVGNVALHFYSEDYDCARAGFVVDGAFVSHLNKLFLRYPTAVFQSFPRVVRKTGLPYNNLMQVVFQEIGTAAATMAIVNGKERALGPVVGVLLRRPRHIQYDGNPIFIVISLYALMSIGCIARN